MTPGPSPSSSRALPRARRGLAGGRHEMGCRGFQEGTSGGRNLRAPAPRKEVAPRPAPLPESRSCAHRWAGGGLARSGCWKGQGAGSPLFPGQGWGRAVGVPRVTCPRPWTRRPEPARSGAARARRRQRLRQVPASQLVTAPARHLRGDRLPRPGPGVLGPSAPANPAPGPLGARAQAH